MKYKKLKVNQFGQWLEEGYRKLVPGVCPHRSEL